MHFKNIVIIRKYFFDLQKWIIEILPTLKPNGTAYIIIGPSKSYGVTINTPEIFSEIITNSGYDVKSKLRYSIINKRMQYPTRNHSAIKTETVLEISGK